MLKKEPEPKRYLRDYSDPFRKYNDEEFHSRYRFSPHTVKDLLLPLIETDLQRSTMRGQPLPPEIMLLITLRYYASGNFQQNLIDDVINVCQPTVSRSIAKVSSLLALNMKKFVKFPEDINGVKEKFYDIAHFPGVIGCIGCTHIKIKSPGEKYSNVFRNKQGWPSINVQAVTGPNMEFYDLVARWPGSTPDTYIYNRSVLKQRLESGCLNGTLLGHGGYTQSEVLFTPFITPDCPSHELYNESLSRTRNTQKVFAVWKKRFPCLEVGISTKIDTIIAVICASAMLYNISILYDNFQPYEFDISINDDCDVNIVNDDHNSEGVLFKQKIIDKFFQTQTK